MISLFWSDRQVRQLPVQRYPNVDACVNVMKKVAEEFCKGSIQRDDFFKRRDEISGAAGVNLKTRIPMKRPAS